MTREHPVPGDGFIDLLAERPGERVAIEIETGKSDIAANVANAPRAEVDRIVLVATSPAAVAACQRVIEDASDEGVPVELMNWSYLS